MSGNNNALRICSKGKRVDIYGESFQDQMRDWLKSAPWLLISLLLHLMLGLCLANVDWQSYSSDPDRIIMAHYEQEEIEPLLEDDPVEHEPSEVEDYEPFAYDPVVTDEVIYEEEEFEEPDQGILDSPLDSRSINDVIGVGGGGGTHFGGKYGRRSDRNQGNQATEKAVSWGLDWLKRHQDPEGFWDCDGFDYQCLDATCAGRGAPLNDSGITGLALLAFLGAGHTPTSGPYKEIVRNGVKYLCSIQDPEDGCLACKENDSYMYNHGIACLALTEAYGLSHYLPIKKHAKKALDFIHASKNPGKAWRYNLGLEIDPSEQNDISVTGWMIMCLTSAKDFGLPYDKNDLTEALLYIDEMTDSASGRTGYRKRGSLSSRQTGDETIWPYDQVEAMTAVAMLCRIFCAPILDDPDSQNEMLDKGAALLMEKPPDWNSEEGSIDYYYWYYGSYAMFQMGGNAWKNWKIPMIKAIVENQETEGCAKGSWDPRYGPWGDQGGRIYSTSLCILCLEAFYRYDHVLGAR